ncbi:phospholipase D-like protein [Haloactinopolyspora alba]|uniref:Phospholipase D-like protein n=1 Tax=Haloactinopolyspora alba TaxID=648780 RepID=A0A2P8DGM3_9ACTN|nr:PLD nuclease N-terminal domain-containing protein [Haloactinopolyspora alba]PSK96380.1 phospholipase D-like protein [Haloactinopolyspora alba]
MGRVLPIVVAIALLVYALIDCFQTESERIRSLNRFLWLAIIVLLPVVGPILWLVLGKADPAQQRAAEPPPQQVAPDDDPEFLRQLREIDQSHEKMLGDWEADLRRREEELRRHGDDEDDSR